MRQLGKFAFLIVPLLASCATMQLSSQGAGTKAGGRASTNYDAAARILDNPDEIFRKAGVTPVFTASPEEARAILPKGMTAVPQQTRTWESWYKDTVTIGGRTIDTAATLRFKQAVASAAATDPSLAFNAPLNKDALISNALSVESNVLNEFDVDKNDSVARQVARLDMAAGWVMHRRHYGLEASKSHMRTEASTGKFATLQQLLDDDKSISCGYAVTNMIYIVREMEKKSPTGVQVGGVYAFGYDSNGKGIAAHSVVGALITLPSGKKATLYYNPTPTGSKQPSVFELATRFGPTNQAVLEDFASRYSIAVLPNDKTLVGNNRTGATYTYPLGENWGARFALGNFDASAVPSYGDYTGGYPDYVKGSMPFKNYKLNNPAPDALEKTLGEVLQKL